MNNNELNEGTRYTYGFEPQPEESLTVIPTRQKRKKSKFGLKIAALMLACTLLGTTGGTLGAFYLMGANQNNAVEVLSLQAPSTVEQLAVTSSSQKLSLQDVFTNSNPAVVAIATETTGHNAFGQTVNLPAAGSGFVISADGYVVTNNHVIEGADTIKVQMSDGKSYDAKVIGADSYTDLAVLKITASGLKYLSFGDSQSLRVGDQVSAIGNPLGELANTFTVGYISALNREINIDGIPRTMLQTDTAVNSGNSGGPLINEYGYVIGVVSAKSSGSNVEGLGFAIPSSVASEIVKELIDNGYVKGRPYMGISAQTRVYNFNDTVLQVATVEAGSGADKAGIKQGDYILEINGTKIADRESLLGALYKLKAGDTIKIKIQREQQTMTVDLVLGEAKGE